MPPYSNVKISFDGDEPTKTYTVYAARGEDDSCDRMGDVNATDPEAAIKCAWGDVDLGDRLVVVEFDPESIWSARAYVYRCEETRETKLVEVL